MHFVKHSHNRSNQCGTRVVLTDHNITSWSKIILTMTKLLSSVRCQCADGQQKQEQLRFLQMHTHTVLAAQACVNSVSVWLIISANHNDPSTAMGSSSQVFVSNLIELGYMDKVTHKHFRATTTEMDNCSAEHCSYLSQQSNMVLKQSEVYHNY